MAQPLHNNNLSSFIKGANTSNSSLAEHNSTATPTKSRSRSGSLLRAISLHSPHPSTTPIETQSTTTSLSRTNTTHSLSRFPSTHANDEVEFAFSSCQPEDFEIKNPIGYGSSAVVYNATYKPKNVRVAIKMTDLDLFERNQIDELRRETALMALSKHPNVLKVYGSFVNGAKLYIATPYLSGGSCLDIMKSTFQDGFEEVIIATILKQALEGLVYLHKNGHIHRNVKSGNLLMDDGGTVVLADFGVSSSLTENNEVRKTIAGTPCWMAPKVMEQSAYDFKADIWNFGITALELATGHTPFAKFPPMKILMMTLNGTPPTLDREHTKHEFSRTFKEMIDYCLYKDPNERPTAEKLLQHPFFKQAKKKEYLVKSVLSYVPPLEQRQHIKIGFKQTTIESTADQQWDFDDKDTTENTAPASPSATTRAVPIQKPHVAFGKVSVNTNKDDLPSPAFSEPEIASPAPIRKSRFVIEEAHNISDRNETSLSSQYSLTRPPNNIFAYSSPPNPIDAAAVFTANESIISPPAAAAANDGNWQSSIGLGLGISSIPAAVAASVQQQQQEVKKGRFSVNHQQTAPPAIKTNIATIIDPKNELSPIDSPMEAVNSLSMSRIANHDNLKGVERKSRFEIQHLPTSSATPQPIVNNNISPPPQAPSPHADDANQQVKFEPAPSSSLSRKSSTTTRHQRSQSRESEYSSGSNNSKVGRFSIEKEDQSQPPQVQPPEIITELSHPLEHSVPPPIAGSSPPECRKKGRFELTGCAVEKLDSPYSTLHSASPNPAAIAAAAAAAAASTPISSPDYHQQQKQQMSHLVYGHMEALLKQTETQRAMLQDLLCGLSNGALPPHMTGGTSRSRSSSFDIQKLVNNMSLVEHMNVLQQQQINMQESKSSPVQNEIISTMEHLQELLLTTSKEKERLLKENEALKKEAERLRKQQPPPSVSNHAAPTTSILKPPTTTTATLLPVTPPTMASLTAAAEKLDACDKLSPTTLPEQQPTPIN